MPTDNENTNEELARLREHNARMLNELKQAKADAKAAKADADAARASLDTATGELTAIKLDGPVSAMLTRVAAPGAVDAVRALMQARGLGFALSATGQPVPTADGKPATSQDKAIAFEPRALADWLCPADVKEDDARRAFAPLLRGSFASGGGAPGSRDGAAPAAQPEAKPAAPRTFGLG